jgi:hypothetical protein
VIPGIPWFIQPNNNTVTFGPVVLKERSRPDPVQASKPVF